MGKIAEGQRCCNDLYCFMLYYIFFSGGNRLYCAPVPGHANGPEGLRKRRRHVPAAAARPY